MLPLFFHFICLLKGTLIYGLQLLLFFQCFFQKLVCFPLLKKTIRTNLLNCLALKSFRKPNKNYITLHISEKIKKKKLKILNQFTRKSETLNVLTNRNFSMDGCYNQDHFAKKYKDFYNDLPTGFQQLYRYSQVNEKPSNVQQKIKDPFFTKNVKILSSTDIRLHDYKDLNEVFSNLCVREKNRYENPEFNGYLVKKFGKKLNFLEIYDVFYKRRCGERKCSCTKGFLKVSALPLIRRKPFESKSFLAIKLTPILENIEYI